MSTSFRRVAVLILLVGLVACGKKEEKIAIPPPVVAEPAAVMPTGPEMISAMLRGHPNSRQVCIDGVRDRSFFLDYGPRLMPGVEADGKYHGWLFIEKVEFFKTSNNTWFITTQEEKKYLEVYPDVIGLTCKAQ